MCGAPTSGLGAVSKTDKVDLLRNELGRYGMPYTIFAVCLLVISKGIEAPINS